MDPINSFCRKMPLNFLIPLGGTSCARPSGSRSNITSCTKSLGILSLYSFLNLLCIALYPRRHPGPSNSFLIASFTSSCHRSVYQTLEIFYQEYEDSTHTVESLLRESLIVPFVATFNWRISPCHSLSFASDRQVGFRTLQAGHFVPSLGYFENRKPLWAMATIGHSKFKFTCVLLFLLLLFQKLFHKSVSFYFRFRTEV